MNFQKIKMLSGITSTGKITIGNYLGALKNLIENQESYELFTFIANLHAITIPIDAKQLNNNIIEMLKIYQACGLNFDKSLVYLQSDIKAIPTLNWILNCNTTIGELSRMTQYKDKASSIKSSNNTNFIPTGILNYPVLMAADILIFSADVVIVGADQKQHIELTRNIAERFNNKFGTTFKIPEFKTNEVSTKIMSLTDPTKKMSKSSDDKKSYILLNDDLNDVRKKIASAITDSDNFIKYDIINKPGVSNLISIFAGFKNISIHQAEAILKNKNYKEFKDYVADAIINEIEKIQTKLKIIDIEKIKTSLKNNAILANKIADKKIDEILNKTGLSIY